MITGLRENHPILPGILGLFALVTAIFTGMQIFILRAIGILIGYIIGNLLLTVIGNQDDLTAAKTHNSMDALGL